MKNVIVLVLLIISGVAAITVYNLTGAQPVHNTGGTPGDPPGTAGTGRGGFSSGQSPMTIEVTTVKRQPISEAILLVGNLTAHAEVSLVPKVSGRLQDVLVRLGSPVSKGQIVARIEDREIAEQVKQAQAAHTVTEASIKQREADLKLAQSNVERSKSLFDRQLLPRQQLDDAEARYAGAIAQLDLSRAQLQQARARLDELDVQLSNTRLVSPVNGFVGKRLLDPGGYASQNSPVVTLVDISLVRIIANLVERDLRKVNVGQTATVEVDALPGDRFAARVARLAPVLDPATRTAEVEVEIPNPRARLKPGMYARVHLAAELSHDALVVPRAALVDQSGRRGVFVPNEGRVRFMPVEIGVSSDEFVEVTKGLDAGATIVTTGATSLRDGQAVRVAGVADTRGSGSTVKGHTTDPSAGQPR